MDYRFKADEWGRLTPEQRAKRCQLLAGEADELAKNASPELRTVYLMVAENWGRLANEIERSMRESFRTQE